MVMSGCRKLGRAQLSSCLSRIFPAWNGKERSCVILGFGRNQVCQAVAVAGIRGDHGAQLQALGQGHRNDRGKQEDDGCLQKAAFVWHRSAPGGCYGGSVEQ